MALNKTGLRVAVVGSRTFADKARLYEVLNKNAAKIKIIVSGGAQGADTLATEWATDYGVPYLVFPALWRHPETLVFDRGAGFRRNRYIVDHSDIVIAFWDGVSTGTTHTMKMAEEAGKRVIVIKFDPPKPTDISKVDLKPVKGVKTEPEETTIKRLVEADKTAGALCCSMPTCEHQEPPECTCHLTAAEAAEAHEQEIAVAEDEFVRGVKVSGGPEPTHVPVAVKPKIDLSDVDTI